MDSGRFLAKTIKPYQWNHMNQIFYNAVVHRSIGECYKEQEKWLQLQYYLGGFIDRVFKTHCINCHVLVQVSNHIPPSVFVVPCSACVNPKYILYQWPTCSYVSEFTLWGVMAECGLVHCTCVLMAESLECGFESQPRLWYLCPWARHLTAVASLHPGV